MYLHEIGTNSHRHEFVATTIYFFLYVLIHDTGLTLNSDRHGLVSVAGPSREILEPYSSHVNDSKSQSRSRNFKPVCFWVSDIAKHVILSQTMHQAFRPVSCKRLQKFHTGKSSNRYEFVTVSC